MTSGLAAKFPNKSNAIFSWSISVNGIYVHAPLIKILLGIASLRPMAVMNTFISHVVQKHGYFPVIALKSNANITNRIGWVSPRWVGIS